MKSAPARITHFFTKQNDIMPAFTKASLDTITDLAIHSINHKLQEALLKEPRLNLNQKIPANVVALQIFKTYNLLTLSADFLLNVPVMLTAEGGLAAQTGIEAYLTSKGDNIRNYAARFIEEQRVAV